MYSFKRNTTTAAVAADEGITVPTLEQAGMAPPELTAEVPLHDPQTTSHYPHYYEYPPPLPVEGDGGPSAAASSFMGAPPQHYRMAGADRLVGEYPGDFAGDGVEEQQQRAEEDELEEDEEEEEERGHGSGGAAEGAPRAAKGSRSSRRTEEIMATYTEPAADAPVPEVLQAFRRLIQQHNVTPPRPWRQIRFDLPTSVAGLRLYPPSPELVQYTEPVTPSPCIVILLEGMLPENMTPREYAAQLVKYLIDLLKYQNASTAITTLRFMKKGAELSQLVVTFAKDVRLATRILGQLQAAGMPAGFGQPIRDYDPNATFQITDYKHTMHDGKGISAEDIEMLLMPFRRSKTADIHILEGFEPGLFYAPVKRPETVYSFLWNPFCSFLIQSALFERYGVLITMALCPHDFLEKGVPYYIQKQQKEMEERQRLARQGGDADALGVDFGELDDDEDDDEDDDGLNPDQQKGEAAPEWAMKAAQEIDIFDFGPKVSGVRGAAAGAPTATTTTTAATSSSANATGLMFVDADTAEDYNEIIGHEDAGQRRKKKPGGADGGDRGGDNGALGASPATTVMAPPPQPLPPPPMTMMTTMMSGESVPPPQVQPRQTGYIQPYPLPPTPPELTTAVAINAFPPPPAYDPFGQPMPQPYGDVYGSADFFQMPPGRPQLEQPPSLLPHSVANSTPATEYPALVEDEVDTHDRGAEDPAEGAPLYDFSAPPQHNSDGGYYAGPSFQRGDGSGASSILGLAPPFDPRFPPPHMPMMGPGYPPMDPYASFQQPPFLHHHHQPGDGHHFQPQLFTAGDDGTYPAMMMMGELPSPPPFMGDGSGSPPPGPYSALPNTTTAQPPLQQQQHPAPPQVPFPMDPEEASRLSSHIEETTRIAFAAAAAHVARWLRRADAGRVALEAAAEGSCVCGQVNPAVAGVPAPTEDMESVLELLTHERAGVRALIQYTGAAPEMVEPRETVLCALMTAPPARAESMDWELVREGGSAEETDDDDGDEEGGKERGSGLAKRSGDEEKAEEASQLLPALLPYLLSMPVGVELCSALAAREGTAAVLAPLLCRCAPPFLLSGAVARLVLCPVITRDPTAGNPLVSRLLRHWLPLLQWLEAHVAAVSQREADPTAAAKRLVSQAGNAMDHLLAAVSGAQRVACRRFSDDQRYVAALVGDAQGVAGPRIWGPTGALRRTLLRLLVNADVVDGQELAGALARHNDGAKPGVEAGATTQGSSTSSGGVHVTKELVSLAVATTSRSLASPVLSEEAAAFCGGVLRLIEIARSNATAGGGDTPKDAAGEHDAVHLLEVVMKAIKLQDVYQRLRAAYLINPAPAHRFSSVQAALSSPTVPPQAPFSSAGARKPVASDHGTGDGRAAAHMHAGSAASKNASPLSAEWKTEWTTGLRYHPAAGDPFTPLPSKWKSSLSRSYGHYYFKPPHGNPTYKHPTDASEFMATPQAFFKEPGVKVTLEQLLHKANSLLAEAAAPGAPAPKTVTMADAEAWVKDQRIRNIPLDLATLKMLGVAYREGNHHRSADNSRGRAAKKRSRSRSRSRSPAARARVAAIAPADLAERLSIMKGYPADGTPFPHLFRGWSVNMSASNGLYAFRPPSGDATFRHPQTRRFYRASPQEFARQRSYAVSELADAAGASRAEVEDWLKDQRVRDTRIDGAVIHLAGVRYAHNIELDDRRGTNKPRSQSSHAAKESGK